jgi:polyisoprenoid-binding protein YceI
MTATAITSETPDVHGRRRHRWLRWVLGGAAAILVLLVVGAVAAVRLQPTAAPLTLPAGAAPVGPIDGVWQPAAGSLAGFRMPQTILGMTSDVVGRTDDLSGSVVIADGRIISAAVRINLLALTSNGRKPAPQFGLSLDTEQYPDANLALAQPVILGDAFASGAPTPLTLTGQLTLKDVTRLVTASLTARRDGANVDVVGSVPVRLADWGIARPTSYGFFGSLGEQGVAEFLVILQRQASR